MRDDKRAAKKSLCMLHACSQMAALQGMREETWLHVLAAEPTTQYGITRLADSAAASEQAGCRAAPGPLLCTLQGLLPAA